MKKSLISMSVAAILASISVAAFASSVTIQKVFTAGTTAVADDVNTNFNDLATGVNDNNARINTNATAISQNADDIAALGGTSACTTDMVAVGSLCVDKYEASLWTAATGGTQLVLAGADPFWGCLANGSDCGPGGTPIYARSVDGVLPAQRVTWHQAVQACKNVGKRLPTAAEWQMAAAGTPSGTGGAGTGCNSNVGNPGSPPSVLDNTGLAGATCVSTAGAFDMVGSLYEWVADISPTVAGGFARLDSTSDFTGMVFGEAYDNASGATPSIHSVVVMDGSGPLVSVGEVADTALLSTNSRLGFRCVK